MSTVKQLAVGAAVNLGAVTTGMLFGFSAVALPAMQAPHHVPRVSDDQASWIASLPSIGAPVGCLVMGSLLDGLGRRRTMLVVNTPALLGWLLMTFAPHHEDWFFYLMYSGRFLTGISAGLATTPAVVYVSEVMDKRIRAVIVTWTSLGVSLGTTLAYALGACFRDDWRLVAGICASFPLVSIIAVWFLVPESPVWLVSRGHLKEAELSMRRVRNVRREDDLPESMQQELVAMTTKSNNGGGDDDRGNWRDTVRFLKRPEAYKPLLIFNGLFFFQQFAGIFVVIFYSVTMLSEMGVQFDGYVASIMIGGTRVVMSAFISFVSLHIGRRTLCLTSGLGMVASLGSLALFLCLRRDGFITGGSWFPVLALVMYILASTGGFLNLPFAMLGEVFPTKIRGMACGATTFMASIYSFLAVKLFPDMRTAWGYHNVITFYTAVAAIATVVMHLYLPETRGKTLDEIEECFRSGASKRTPVLRRN